MKDGEQGDDFDVGSSLFRQPQTVLKNSGPVRNTVIAAKWQGVIFKDGVGGLASGSWFLLCRSRMPISPQNEDPLQRQSQQVNER